MAPERNPAWTPVILEIDTSATDLLVPPILFENGAALEMNMYRYGVFDRQEHCSMGRGGHLDQPQAAERAHANAPLESSGVASLDDDRALAKTEEALLPEGSALTRRDGVCIYSDHGALGRPPR